MPRELDPELILRAAMDRGDRVTRFEIADPSLEEIFIERVGIRPGDELDLATPGGPLATSAVDGEATAGGGATLAGAPSEGGH